jgi:CMP-N-acetylneuraminic acid synthetase
MKWLCAIPARAGSVRVPGKNVREMAGKPLLVHSIEVAQRSALFDEVFVCTEDPRIADIAERHGATVPGVMPPDLCADDVASHTPCMHLADRLAAAGDGRDALMCLQPTSPLRDVEDIVRAVHRLEEESCDFVVSVTALDPHDFHWAVHEDPIGQWQMFFGDRFMDERWRLPVVYRPNGAIKAGRLAALTRVGHFFGAGLGTIEMPPERAVHVGTPFDWQVCELMMQRQVHAG